MSMKPNWLEQLENEDINFIKRFILASGSLKEIANIYEVSYPTVRLRLDRLIQKIELAEHQENEFVKMVKKLTIDEKIELDVAKVIIQAYLNEKGDER